MEAIELLRATPVAFYKPNRACPEALLTQYGGTPGVSRSKGDLPFFFADEEIRVATGGNRSAKTTKIIIESGSTLTGYRPWVNPDSEWFTRGLVKSATSRRVRVFFVISNYKTKIPEIMEELEKWWPRKYFWKITASDKEGPREITWFNGNVIRLFSHKLNVEDLEGTEAELMVFDEPPPEGVWNSLTRGLLSTSGKAIVGATLLDKTEWFWDTIVYPGDSGMDPEIRVTWHSIWDNIAENGGCPTQPGAKVGRYLARFRDPEERLAREHGHPMHVGGLVLSAFAKSNVVDPFELPQDCIIYSCIDPAAARPIAATWIAILQNLNPVEMHLFDESYDNRTRNDLALFAEDFLAKEQGISFIFHPTPSVLTLIDPAANQTLKGDEYGRDMVRILHEDYGIQTRPADKRNKGARLRSLNGKCADQQFKIWSQCRRAMHEVYKWKWDETSVKLTTGPDDVLDGASYIESFDPVRQATALQDDSMPDVWIPDEYIKQERRRKDNLLKSREKYRRRKAQRESVFRGYRENPHEYVKRREV